MLKIISISKIFFYKTRFSKYYIFIIILNSTANDAILAQKI